MSDKKQGFKKAISFILVLLLCFGGNMALVFADGSIADLVVGKAGGAEVYSYLDDIQLVLEQDNKPITDGKLDPKKDIKVKCSFKVPVGGDFPPPEHFVIGGDFATFEFPVLLQIGNTSQMPLYSSGEAIGTVDFQSNQIVVTFGEILNPDLENPGSSRGDVKAEFWADMSCDLSSEELSKPGEHTIMILGKEFVIVVPEKENVLSITKEGTADLSEKKVKWKVKLAAELEGGTEGPLDGCVFTDDLSSVGTYVEGSFKLGQLEAGTDAQPVEPATTSPALSYTFPIPADSGSPGVAATPAATGTRYLFFETEIPDDKYYANGEKTITNTAKAAIPGQQPKDVPAKVTFASIWIEKNGKPLNESTSEGGYNPIGRQIQWTIEVNQNSATLTDAKITDIMPRGLELVSATLKIGDAFTQVDPLPTNGVYSLGTISEPVTLIILAKVTSEAHPEATISFKNTASLSWVGYSGGIETSADALIGFQPITKAAVSDYSSADHTIGWKVDVDTKKLTYGGNLRVLDLLVYGENLGSIDGIDDISPASGSQGNLLDVDLDEIKARLNDQTLIPSYNQRFVRGNPTDSFTGQGLDHQVYQLKRDGKPIADLLVVTATGGASLPTTGAITFSYKSSITNPKIYASNVKGLTIKNTAHLFSQDIVKSTGEAIKKINSTMLYKDMLTREGAADFLSANGLAAINKGTSAANKGFDYNDKSVIFRLHINGNNLANAQKHETAVDGVNLGKLNVSDVLPKGWSFGTFKNDERYVLCQAEGSGNALTAKSVIDSVPSTFQATFEKDPSSQIESMTFNFDELNEQYIILVKAVADEKTAADMFAGNKDTTITNKAKLASESTDLAAVEQKFTVESKLLSKDCLTDKENQGYVTWKVDYVPYDQSHEGARLEDTIPQGLELRTDAMGKLKLAGNITIQALTINRDGTTSVTGDPIDLNVNKLVSYGTKSRILQFKIPDSKVAYRFQYITDITGEGNKEVRNQVKLLGGAAGESGVNSAMSYTISANGASASMSRYAYVKINKTDIGGQPLKGVEFTLYAKDGVTVVRSGVSNDKGIINLLALPEGEYVLKETKHLQGYVPSERSHKVVVTGITASIDGGSKELTVVNLPEGTVGKLQITKKLSGNAAETGKAFDFTVTLTDASGNPVQGSYDYIGSGGLADGKITLNVSGEAIMALKGGQSAVISDLPKESKFTVAEKDYSADGYTSASTGASGEIKVDDTAVSTFTNTKNSTGGGGTGGGTGGGGGGGGGNKPQPPIIPPVEPGTDPEQPEIPTNPTDPTNPVNPENPAVTPEQPLVPPVTSGSGTSAPDGVTETYPERRIPNPGRADSPDVIYVIDEEGVPLGYFYKHEKDDGTFEYINDEGVPLAYIDTPQTGDNMRIDLLAAIMLLSLCEAGVLTLYRKKYGRTVRR